MPSQYKTLPISARRPRLVDKNKTITDPDAFHFSMGSILGDGSITNKTKNYSLEIENSSPSYLMWKYKLALKYNIIIDRGQRYPIKAFKSKAKLPFIMKVRPPRAANNTRDVYRSFRIQTRSSCWMAWPFL